ncbi:hypothetical protein ACS91_00080 [Vibrio parahaemolyticus]|nr:hypothetical protein ACS91_00080 [Vibrio parahaemolyticus]
MERVAVMFMRFIKLIKKSCRVAEDGLNAVIVFQSETVTGYKVRCLLKYIEEAMRCIFVIMTFQELNAFPSQFAQ